MTPGRYIIMEVFGGLAKTAHALTTPEKRLPKTTVQRWRDSGRIPQEWWMPMIEAAKAEGKHIELADFLNEHPEEAA